MTTTTKANGRARGNTRPGAPKPPNEPQEVDKSVWPDVSTAAEQIGIDQSNVRRMIQRGALSRHTHEGNLRIDPAELDDVIARREQVLEGSETDRAASDRVIAQMTSEALTYCNMLANQNKQLLEGITKPMQMVMNALQSQYVAQNERLKFLEEKAAETAELREKLANEAHDRLLSEKAFMATERRKDEAVALLMREAPGLLNAVATTVMGKESKRLSAAQKLLDSLDPEMLSIIRENLSEEQISWLDQLRGNPSQGDAATQEHENK